MASLRSWMLALVVVGCTHRANTIVDAGPLKGHPDLQCPPGAIPEGFGPPNGLSAWCLLTLPSGKRVKEGPAFEWHENGARASTGQYAQDLRVGEWVSYHPTGTPRERGSYVANKQDGVWTTWAPGGEKLSEGSFVNGVEQGGWTYWNLETLMRTEGAFLLGQKDGKWYDYTPEGVAARERIFREGRLITQREL